MGSPRFSRIGFTDGCRNDGISFASILEAGSAPSDDRTVYWELHQAQVQQAVRWGEWKALREGGLGAPIELFDLQRDPAERFNLADRHPDIVAKARQLFDDLRTESTD